MITALWIAYGVVGLLIGYYTGREVYQNGTSDGIRPRSTGAALFFLVVYGAAWPALFLILLLIAIAQGNAWKALGERLFG